jgi:hypothetical protein
MKINAVEDYEIIDRTPNLKRVAVTIHDVGHHMRVLAETTYSKPIEAVVRETIANAIDASRGANFNVTSPSLLDPNFRVRDFGVGMTEAFFTEEYTKVGCSTKRESNDEIGGFGMGRFAAFAYKGCDVFYVVGYKDGRYFRGKVSRDAGFNVFVDVEGTGFTTEPDGVEIVIPVLTADHSKFRDAIQIYTEFVPNADTDVEKLTRPTLLEGPGWKLSSIDSSAGFKGHDLRAIMGGIPVPVNIYEVSLPYDGRRELANNFEYADLHFPIGALSLAASRETLRYDDATKKAIVDKFTQIKADIEGRKAQIEAKYTTQWERWTANDVITLRKLFGRGFEHLELRTVPGLEVARNLTGDIDKRFQRRRHNFTQLEFAPNRKYHVFLLDDERLWRRKLNIEIENLKDVADNARLEYVLVVRDQLGLDKLGNPPYRLISSLPKPPPPVRLPRSSSPKPAQPARVYYVDGIARPADYSEPGRVYVPFKISLIDDEWVELYNHWPFDERPVGVPAADIKTAQEAGWIRLDDYLKSKITPEILRAFGMRDHDPFQYNSQRAMKTLVQLKWDPKPAIMKKLVEYYSVLDNHENRKWFRALELLKVPPGKIGIHLSKVYDVVKAKHPAFDMLLRTGALTQGYLQDSEILALASKSL